LLFVVLLLAIISTAHVKVQCSQEQFAAGEHYDAARECIEDNHKVSGPFWMCDEKDHSGLIPLLNINWENKDVDLTNVAEQK